MKKTKSLILLLVFVLVLSFAFTACKKPVEDDTPKYEKQLLANWQEYTITFSDAETASNVVSEAFYDFTLAFSDKYGGMLPTYSDFLIPGETPPEGTLEILVGNTNRPESIQIAETLRASDYFIGLVNNRLVIVGGSEKATAEAIKHYASYLLGDQGLMYPSALEGYRYEAKYPVNKLTVNGVDISEYVIVRGNGMAAGDRSLINSLRDLIAAISGENIPVVLASAPEAEYEIIFGNTGRAETTAKLNDGTYSVVQTDKKLALYGSGEGADSYVLSKFIGEVLLSIPECDSYDIKLDNVTAEDFDVPSFTISNLPSGLASVAGKYKDAYESAQATLDRFMLTKEELPSEVTVLNRKSVEDYPFLSYKKQIYVSAAKGDDANPGTEKAPFKTIAKAVSAMKNEGGGIIWVEGGQYDIDTAITLNSQHSGTVVSPLVIKGYGDEEVVITGNKPVDGSLFAPVDVANDPVAKRLHEEVWDKVVYLNLFDMGWTQYDIVEITKSGMKPSLFADGEELILARFPNKYDENGNLNGLEKMLYFTKTYDMGTVSDPVGGILYPEWVKRVESDPNLTLDTIIGWEIEIPAKKGAATPSEAYLGEEIITWVNTGDIWYYGNIYSGYEFNYYTIAPDCVHGSDNLLGIMKPGGYFSLKSVQNYQHGCRPSTNSPVKRNTYYLFNAIEALDAPGEWFIDKYTGNLYLYPTTDDVKSQKISYSYKSEFSVFNLQSTSFVILDGITINGANMKGVEMKDCNEVILQNMSIANTKSDSVNITDSYNVGVIHSEFSNSSTRMIMTYNTDAKNNLIPDNVFIQNNLFYNPAPTTAYAINLYGCRTVVSHNLLIDTGVVISNGAECIVEYNEFAGGSADVADGGMVYMGAGDQKGNHIRYNLFHMFKAPHNAVYNDGMASGNYTYGNLISTLDATASRANGWYVSTGHSNVCYGNIMVYRNPAQIAYATSGKVVNPDTVKANQGDYISYSGLYYYYRGELATNRDEINGNSEAGTWWRPYKEKDYNRYKVQSSQTAWNARYPDLMNTLDGLNVVLSAYNDPSCDYMVYYDVQKLSNRTVTYPFENGKVMNIPQYYYLDDNGNKQLMKEHQVVGKNDQITLTFDDLAAFERLYRQPAYNVVSNNLILGGSTTKANLIRNSTTSFKGIVNGTDLHENNYFEYDYNKIMVDADNYDYTIKDSAWTEIEESMGTQFVDIIKELDMSRIGFTK